MSFNKFKNDYCVGGKPYSATASIRRYVTGNKKTEAPVKLLRGTSGNCNRNKPPLVPDQTIQAEGLEDFSKI